MHMNKKLICLLIILLLISCKKEESILIKQISTNEMATINLDYQYAETKDSICLTIPLHEVFAIAVRSLLTSYPLLYSVPILFIDSLCGLLECVRSRETSHSEGK